MQKTEVNELKKRFTKEKASFSRLCGCYVDSAKNKIQMFNNSFISLEEEEMFKYLEIAKKSLSGKIGNNLLNLAFPNKEEEEGGVQNILFKMRNDSLKNEETINAFYDHIIETYKTPDNYFIVLFKDDYDIPVKTKDNIKLGDSIEVFSYIICAICPVQLSKSSLGYVEYNKKIEILSRDWEVKPPETAFLFPSFNDRSTDIHNLLFYTKNTKEPHTEFIENGLKCPIVETDDENKVKFEDIVSRSVKNDRTRNNVEDILLNMNYHINEEVEEYNAAYEDSKDFTPLVLDEKLVTKVLDDMEISEEEINKVIDEFNQNFKEKDLKAENFVDKNKLEKNELKLENMRLKEEIKRLNEEIKKLKGI